MGSQHRSIQAFTLGLIPIALAAMLVYCGDDSDSGGSTSSSVTISAPSIVGPNSSTPTGDTQPTLTVNNASASGGSTPTYTFQVATDSGFANIVVQQSGLSQGSGQTSWQVSQALANGAYFWRARADVSGTAGPFSAGANLVIAGVGGGAGETLVVYDSLTDGPGATQATNRSGGSFTDQGWRVNNNGNYLRYSVPTIVNGYVEWQNTGLTPRGANAASHMMFGMWDPTAGDYRENRFRVHVQKLWSNPHNPPFMRLRWISQGRLADAGYGFTGWDPGQTYTFRVDWGPSAGSNTARVFLDGLEIMQVRYNRPYEPNTHFIELGISERGESVIDAVYSNFAVVRRN